MPALIIHGGAGRARSPEGHKAITDALYRIASDCWSMILRGDTAMSVAIHGAVLLEDDPLFNAGYGSKLQRDGKARLSAALMDGEHRRFSGVVNAQGILNPILLCEQLQSERDRVLAGEGATQRAASLGLPHGDARSPQAIEAWNRAIEGETGTIGAVVLDQQGRIAAATSTGGRGMEGPGRVSDSCTVAGNYATPHAGVSCTGIGEDIVDGALAVRIVSAVESGMSLKNASQMLKGRMETHDWDAGLIALDNTGAWSAIHTTEIMYWYAIDGAGHHRFQDPDDA
mgnify:CR=1 FL=1